MNLTIKIVIMMHMMTTMTMHIPIWRMTAILWLLFVVATLILKKSTTTEKCFDMFKFSLEL